MFLYFYFYIIINIQERGRRDSSVGQQRMLGQKVVVFGDRQYTITHQMYDTMKYFEESEAISKTNRHVVTVFSSQLWQKMINILETIDYRFVKIPRVIVESDPKDIIGGKLTEIFQTLSKEELNEMYKLAQYMKLLELKNSIAAYLTSQIMMTLTLDNYNKIKQKLGVEEDLSSQKWEELKEKYSFIN